MKPDNGARPHELLQQTPPFLFIDRIIESNEREILCLKNVSYNEPYLSGHFPGNPIVPGVLLIEMCAQACMLLVRNNGEKNTDYDGQPGYLAKVDNVKFYTPVRPGDILGIRVTMETEMGNYQRMKANVFDTETEKTVCKGYIIVYLPKEKRS